MKKIKPNLNTFCISHKYDKFLDKINLKIIGSGGSNKKYPSHWLNDAKGKKNISNKNKINDDNTNISGEIITAPLSGNIFSIVKNNGESVELDDTVIVLEAMKMETTIKTPLNGIIKKVFVKNGDKVNVGDPLFEVI